MEYQPECAHLPMLLDEQFDCQSCEYTATIWEYCCTCKMGPKRYKTAVADPELHVHDIENQRVIDASLVYPKVIGGHTNAPTIMVCKKGAADMIKQTWGYH